MNAKEECRVETPFNIMPLRRILQKVSEKRRALNQLIFLVRNSCSDWLMPSPTKRSMRCVL